MTERFHTLSEFAQGSSSRLALRQLSYSFPRLADGMKQLSGTEAAESVHFYAMADFSTSLNVFRARMGYPIGGILTWGDGTVPVIPAGIGPNHCGILVAEIGKLPDEQDLQGRMSRLQEHMPKIDGTLLQWDLGRKNHFLNIYRSDSGRLLVIMHCSLPEARADNPWGFGHGLTESPILQGMTTRVATRVGTGEFFVGDEALRVRDQNALYESLARRKREVLCNALFDDAVVLSNVSHMRMLDLNAIQLGCNAAFHPLRHVPLMVGPGRDAYLVDMADPVTVCGRSVFLAPHGTGARATVPGDVGFDPDSCRHVVRHEGRQQYFDRLEEIFGDYNDDRHALAQVAQSGHHLQETLSPVIETKLM